MKPQAEAQTLDRPGEAEAPFILFSSFFGFPVAGGGLAFSAMIAAEWLKRGHRVVVICSSSPRERQLGELNPFLTSGRLVLESVITPRELEEPHRYSTAVRARTKAILERWRPAEIHVHNFHGLIGGLWAAVESGATTVYTALDFGLECPTWYLYDGSPVPCSGAAPKKCVECVLKTNHLRARDVFYHGAGLVRRALGRGGIAHGHKAFFSLGAHRYWRGIGQELRWMHPLFARFDHIIAPSPPVYDIVQQRRGVESGIHRILYPVPAGKIRPENGPVPAEIPARLVFFGHSSPIKGWGFFLRVLDSLPDGLALEIIDANGNDTYYRNAGPRVRRYLKRSFRQIDVAASLAEADAVLVPSLWHENTPLVVIEALANHRPVVASDQAGIRHVVHEGTNGRLFAPGNLEAWQAGLIAIARNPADLRSMRARCDYNMTVPAYVDAIARAISGRGGSP